MEKKTIDYECGSCGYMISIDVLSQKYSPKFSLNQRVRVVPSMIGGLYNSEGYVENIREEDKWMGQIVQININAAGITYNILSEFARIVEYVKENKIELI